MQERKTDWPASGEELRARGYKPNGRKRCKCGAEIVFARTPRGEALPLVEVARPLTAPEGKYFQPHFADCPLAKRFRKGGKRARRV